MLGYTLAAACGGALIGSFLNVVIHRLPLGENIATGRSRCPGCGATIRGYDNMPGDLVAAAARALPRLRRADRMAVPGGRAVDGRRLRGDRRRERGRQGPAARARFAAILITCAGIDLEHHIIPNKIVAPAAVFAVVGGRVHRSRDVARVPRRGRGRISVPAARGARLSRRDGHGRRQARRGHGSLPRASRSCPRSCSPSSSGRSWGSRSSRARDATEGRKTGVPFGPFLAVGGDARPARRSAT